ncbi:MAG: enoyl-CoA hydratase/isomerase family protein [Gammaproteobacteria bacterium]|nr:enoyl-CoA hydratase/isomerase family protein [Gammaproteobacteria bacterium]
MSEPVVTCEIDARGIAHVTLNRPEVNNAYNQDMISGLLEGVMALSVNDDVRLIVLRGNGRYFQAGADLKFMEALGKRAFDENLHMSQITTDLVRYLDECPKPTIALVQGGAFGGGVGVLCACDVVIASQEAIFSIAEVRWGLVAGPIVPQMCAAIGTRNVRRYALSAETFDAARACEMGLVHEVCATGKLEETAAPIIDKFLKNSPSAIAETKAIMFDTAYSRVDDALANHLALEHALRRRTEEGMEGLASFKEKREASWYPGPAKD